MESFVVFMKTLQKDEEKMWSSRLKNGLNEEWIKVIFGSVKQKNERYCTVFINSSIKEKQD